MNPYLDRLKMGKGLSDLPPEPTKDPFVSFDGTVNRAFPKHDAVVGAYTPWHPPVSPHAVRELHALIAEFARLYRLSDAATARIISVAKRQPAATVPDDIRMLKKQIAGHGG